MNILFIGAHYDDIELGCGGTILKHIQQGDKVHMLVITNSEYRDYNGKLLRSRNTAMEEGINAARLLGIKETINLDYKTKTLQHDFKLIEDINKVIDRHKIDTVYTHWVHDTHQDHSSTGKCTLNAARHCKRILMYRSNWYACAEQFRGNFYVDISDVIDKKIKAIQTHKSECGKNGKEWLDFVIQKNRNSGIEMETEYAECFEIVRYLI